MVCLLFVSLKITMHRETGCGCWNLVPAQNALGGFVGLLALFSLSQSTRVLEAPGKHCLELNSKNLLFLLLFHFVHSHVGRRTLQPTGFARLHAVSPQILQTKKVWTRESARVGWSIIAEASDPFEGILPWFWKWCTELGVWRNLQLVRPSWCSIRKSSIWFLRKKLNSAEVLSKFTTHISSACYTNDNSKYLAKFLDPGSDPKPCGSLLLCCNSRICQLLLRNWGEKRMNKTLLQIQIHLNQSQNLQILKVIRTGHEWSVTYCGRQKPHVSLGSKIASLLILLALD